MEDMAQGPAAFFLSENEKSVKEGQFTFVPQHPFKQKWLVSLPTNFF
jgi:hypothetical protein